MQEERHNRLIIAINPTNSLLSRKENGFFKFTNGRFKPINFNNQRASENLRSTIKEGSNCSTLPPIYREEKCQVSKPESINTGHQEAAITVKTNLTSLVTAHKRSVNTDKENSCQS